MEFDVAKDLVFALREVGLEAEALQGAYYNGVMRVTEDQQVALEPCELEVTAGERPASNAKNLEKPINKHTTSLLQRLKECSET